ncbi:chalcone isomerase family protein [Kangiella sp. HZ709]|uniref:chalcone isomerase family protein n=1 Tax=Kangiella sp. HZ709 TaxID=2666328 RepID=UPI0012B124E0|nr:chalcone isomerase family protein [Kangiella sp. HZ709]MRX27792.1 hypothetical protein [Kangiella sp. HZ709]
MKYKFLIVILLFFTPTAFSKDRLPSSIVVNERNFNKCSEVRITKALFFKILDLGLYAPDCQSFSSVFSKSEKLIRFKYLRTVTGQEFKEGAEEYLGKNLPKQRLEQCQKPFNNLNQLYKNVNDGDFYQLIQSKDNAISITLNNQLIGSIENPDCAIDYYHMWFGKESMDTGFQKLIRKAIKNQKKS